MTERRSYDASFANPHPDSFFSYVLTGFAILDAEPTPELWHRPLAVDAATNPHLAAWADRHNPALQASEDFVRSEVIAELKVAGMPAERFGKRIPQELSAYIDSRVADKYASLFALAKIREETQPTDIKPFKRQTLVVAGVLWTTPQPGSDTSWYVRAAEKLNHGIATKDNAYVLSSHHVRRGYKRLARDLGWLANELDRQAGPISGDLIVRAQMSSMIAAIEEFSCVYADARRHPHFRSLKGSILAQQIDANFGLASKLQRARLLIGQRQRGPKPAA